MGANHLVQATQTIAMELDLPMVVISLTVVALGTSLPELATCLVAALRKDPDLAVGNIVGSNIFNVLFVLGGTSLIRPIEVAQSVINRDIWVMIGFAAICLPIMWTRGTLTRLEGSLLVIAYLTYSGVVLSV